MPEISAAAAVGVLRAAGVGRGGDVGIVVAAGVGCGLAAAGGMWWTTDADPGATVRAVEAELRPRWTWWSNSTATELAAAGARVALCWDVAAVHRLVFGEWQAEPQRVWARLLDLDVHSIPGMGQMELLHTGTDEGTDVEEPVRPDGHLRPEWTSGGWADSPQRLARWAAVALDAADAQRRRIAAMDASQRVEATARAESGAELLCVELERDGLPIDVGRAEEIIAGFVGPRPEDGAAEIGARQRRDDRVLGLAGVGARTDLRNPAQVRAMLHRFGVDVPDTRAWRLERFRATNPVVDALLVWRQAERIDTTFGYSWLDQHVGSDGRLRGGWSGSDGAAGRMTAQAGLHNLPAELRPAVAADAGWVLVRADLGQIEPRVLAAISGDRGLAAASGADDLYAPVATRLGVERSVAKVAVLAAMYGQTTGAAGQALAAMEVAYPVALQFLRNAEEAGRRGDDVVTFGGRTVRMWHLGDDVIAVPDRERAVRAARGRFARNAVVQGAAAELFKAWAVTVRARCARLGATIVLCLHDELLVHAPAERGATVADAVATALQEAAARWARRNGGDDHVPTDVRFVADISVLERWSDAMS